MLTGSDAQLIKGLKPSPKVQIASAFAANPSCLPSRAHMSREALSNVGVIRGEFMVFSPPVS